MIKIFEVGFVAFSFVSMWFSCLFSFLFWTDYIWLFKVPEQIMWNKKQPYKASKEKQRKRFSYQLICYET